MATRRRRCSTCRKWFRPERSAQRTQLVCSSECRLARRAKLERKRAADDPERREAERLRKRRWRERRKDSGAVSLTVPDVSLTGLAADPPPDKPIRDEKWDTATRLSLTGLVAGMARLQADLVRIVGQVGHG